MLTQIRFLLLICLAFTWIGCTPVAPAVLQDAHEAQPEAAKGAVSRIESAVLESVGSYPSETGGGEVKIVGGDEATLREFIQRWLGAAYAYPGAPAGDTVIRIGDLPDDLPVDLPIPENARIVASMQEPHAFMQLILDVEKDPNSVLEFYRRSLTSTGWTIAPEMSFGSGFIAAGGFGEGYCLGDSEAHLQVSASEVVDRPTDVRLHLHVPAQPYQCEGQEPGYMDPAMRLIPTLEAPVGAQMTGGSAGGSSDGNAYTSTDLMTSLSADALLAHYNPQLTEAGWQLFEQGSSEVVSWSTWRLVDEGGGEWAGALIVMDTKLSKDRRFALFTVEKAP